MNFGGAQGDVHGGPYIFCSLLKKKRIKYKSMTYTKIKFHIILIKIFFPRMNNKKIKKRGLLNFKERGSKAELK